ncbi:MAG: SUMF1/EgtB/PvdO family nonheme iron enzyme [Polyangiaceae bacterium]|jgi:formylglycine-generating enzyme|nr:SUMF1/EgtB/PvdO family nonheme iron enzyme [Polyangiaceae bacterium]
MAPRATLGFVGLGLLFWSAFPGCGPGTPEPLVPPAAPPAPAPSTPPPPIVEPAETPVAVEPSASGSPCPADMVLVEGSYCPKVARTCLYKEYDPVNHIELCHKFEHTTKCLAPEEPRAFCIDKYEYPNREGAHPPWMVSWHDGQATCGSLGKRLCYESEWVTACEGPDRSPFPYGWDRDNSACNIDNWYVDPSLSKMYSKDPAVSSAELERLDQSVPSGAMNRCVSGYGVHDLTGNFDEWVTNDNPPEDKSEWAGLKGGAWGHVRNACRPMTTSHPPDFTYYFISFRCCADPAGRPAYTPTRGKKAPTVPPADRAPLPKVSHSAGPSKTKVPAQRRAR